MTNDGAIGTWDCRSNEFVRTTKSTFGTPFVATSNNDRWTSIICSPSRMVILYDLEKDRELFALGPEVNDVWANEWSPDGSRLAVGLPDGGLAIWKLEEVRARLAEFGIDVPSTSAGATPGS